MKIKSRHSVGAMPRHDPQFIQPLKMNEESVKNISSNFHDLTSFPFPVLCFV